MREFHVSMRDLCIRYKGTLSGRSGRFISPIASLHESPRAALDGWIIQERVLCHRLESTPRLPAPAACTPLETNQYGLLLKRVKLCGRKTDRKQIKGGRELAESTNARTIKGQERGIVLIFY